MENENEEEKQDRTIKKQLNGNDISENNKEDNNIEKIQEENTTIKIKKINLWLLLILLILAILSLTYILTDLFKTDEQNFYKYMYITSKNIDNLKSDELEKYFQKTKYTSEGSIEADCYGEKLKVEFDGSTNIENRIKETNIKTKYGNSDIEIKYKQDKDTYGIKIEEFYEKYIAVENNNLKELASKLGFDNDKIPDIINLEKYKFTEEELKDIKKRYIEIIRKEINKENYTNEKNNDFTIYKLNLTNKELNNIKIESLQELKNDNLVLDKYIMYEELNGNKIEKVNIKKEIEEKIKKLKENTFEVDEEALEISLYTNLNKCKKIEIKLLEDTILIEMDLNSLEITNKQDNKIGFKIQKEEIAQELKYSIKVEKQNFNFTINLNYYNLSKDTIKEQYDVDFNIDNENIKFTYINETVQNENVTINNIESNECEILNKLNKNEVNQLIYKIYCNMIDL